MPKCKTTEPDQSSIENEDSENKDRRLKAPSKMKNTTENADSLENEDLLENEDPLEKHGVKNFMLGWCLST